MFSINFLQKALIIFISAFAVSIGISKAQLGDLDFSYFNSHGELKVTESDGNNKHFKLKHQKIYLINRRLDTVQTQRTDEYGQFNFKKIKSGQGFLLIFAPNDTIKHAKKIVFTYDYGRSSMTLKRAPDSTFKMEIIKNEYEDVSHKTLVQALDDAQKKASARLKGKLLCDKTGDKKEPLIKQIIHLKNNDEKIIQTAKTDKEGNFEFFDVPKEQKMHIAIDENKTLPEGCKVYLAGQNGEVIREFKKDKNGYRFEVLPSDFKELAMIDDVPDPIIQAPVYVTKEKPLTVAEPIFYEEGAYEVTTELARRLEKVALIIKSDPGIVVEIKSHTDAKGTDEANLNLSDKRAKAAAAYLVMELNIDPKKVIGQGYGESKLLNDCKDFSKCPEDENAKNRRTEFVFTKKS